jgi:hypothetical protein
MLYGGRYTMRRRSRAKFFLRAGLGDAWSAVTATPRRLDDPFGDPKVQERMGALIAFSVLGSDGLHGPGSLTLYRRR